MFLYIKRELSLLVVVVVVVDSKVLASQITDFYAELSAFQNTSNQFNEFTSISRLIEFLEQSIDPYGIEGLLKVDGYQGATFPALFHFLTFHFQPIQRPYCALVRLEAFLLFV